MTQLPPNSCARLREALGPCLFSLVGCLWFQRHDSCFSRIWQPPTVLLARFELSASRWEADPEDEGKAGVPATAVQAESPVVSSSICIRMLNYNYKRGPGFPRAWEQPAGTGRDRRICLMMIHPNLTQRHLSTHASATVTLPCPPASVLWGQHKSNADTSHPEVSSVTLEQTVPSNRITAWTESQNWIIRHTFHSSTYTVAASFNVFLKMLAKPPLWSVEFMVCLSSSLLSPPISISVSVYPACLTVNPSCVLVCIVDISHNPNLRCYEPGVLGIFFFLLVIHQNFCCGRIHVIINVSGISFIKFRHASVLWLLMHR